VLWKASYMGEVLLEERYGRSEYLLTAPPYLVEEKFRKLGLCGAGEEPDNNFSGWGWDDSHVSPERVPLSAPQPTTPKK
jgi:hypothetical protein